MSAIASYYKNQQKEEKNPLIKRQDDQNTKRMGSSPDSDNDIFGIVQQ